MVADVSCSEIMFNTFSSKPLHSAWSYDSKGGALSALFSPKENQSAREESELISKCGFLRLHVLLHICTGNIKRRFVVPM